MYCFVDEKNVIHYTATGVLRNVVIDSERISVKNIDLYKCVLEEERKAIQSLRAPSNASTTRASSSSIRNRPKYS